VVVTATRLMVGGAGVRIPLGVRFFSAERPDLLWSQMLRTEQVSESFPSGKAAREVKLTTHVNLVQRLGMTETI